MYLEIKIHYFKTVVKRLSKGFSREPKIGGRSFGWRVTLAKKRIRVE